MCDAGRSSGEETVNGLIVTPAVVVVFGFIFLPIPDPGLNSASAIRVCLQSSVAQPVVQNWVSEGSAGSEGSTR